MAFPSITYNFVNGTAADGDQVDTNFQDLVNGFSDGTKDINMSAATFAGTVTFNGNVLLGNASGDDVQFNGSLATSIPIKTTRTYDIGSADLGLRIIYMGMNSTHTIALAAPSSGASADYSLTLPPVVGGVGDLPYNTGSGTLLWKPSGIVVDAAAGASGVTLTTTDEDVHVFSPTTGITVKLDNSFTIGRVLRIVNTGTGADDIITLTANDDAVIRKIYPDTVAEVICISSSPSTNTSWKGLNRVVSGWITGAGFTPNGFGTVSSTFYAYRREGKTMIGRLAWVNGTVAASTASVDLPSSHNMDTDFLSSAVDTVVGVGMRIKGAAGEVTFGAGNASFIMFFDNSDTNTLYIAQGADSGIINKVNASTPFASSDRMSMDFQIPINEWGEFSS